MKAMVIALTLSLMLSGCQKRINLDDALGVVERTAQHDLKRFPIDSKYTDELAADRLLQADKEIVILNLKLRIIRKQIDNIRTALGDKGIFSNLFKER